MKKESNKKTPYHASTLGECGKMKIVTYATLKGGSGKTTTIFNLAGVLAKTHRILLIDVDPQCNLTQNCGIDIGDFEMKTIKDVFENFFEEQPTPEELIIKQPIEELENLDLIPSSIFLFRTDRKLYTVTNKDAFLYYYIEDNRAYFENNYDYIFIDTNPSLSITNINAFYVADDIVLTSDISLNSITGAELFCDMWDADRKPLRKSDNISALIICNSDRRTTLGNKMMDYAQNSKVTQDLILKTIIPMTKKIKVSEIKHKPVSVLYPKEEITKLYKQVADELKEKGVL